jgi:hypothetical protein
MWTCPKCQERIEDQFDSCWKCATPKATLPPRAGEGEDAPPKRRLAYRMFRGTWATLEELFDQAAEFANELGSERVLNISHSADRNDGVVTVWYWTTGDEPPEV